MSARRITALFLSAFMLLSLLLTACAAPTPTQAPTQGPTSVPTQEPEKKLVIAHDYQTEHPIHIAALEFADAVNKSGTALKCEVYPNGALYQSNWDILIEMLQSNTVQAGIDSITVFSSVVQNMSALQLPFMFSGTEELQKLIESKPAIIEKWKTEANDKKLVIGAMNAKSFRGLINNKAMVKTPADISGKKYRVPNNPFFVKVFEALGAKPVPLPSGEIYSAIQLGTVIGEDNPIPNVFDSKTYEVAKYYTDWNYIADGDVLVFSKDFYDSLTAAEKKVVDDASAQFSKSLYAMNAQFRDEAKKKMEAAGVEFYPMSDAEKEPFKVLMQPLYDEKKTAMGSDWDVLMSSIEAIR